MIYNPTTLPKKFQPYVLKDQDTLNELDQEYSSKTRITNNVFETANWILKSGRTDGETTPDTPLYRVRKATKIEKYIQKNNLQDQLFVPKKYLYWRKDEGQYYVACEKTDLSNEVAKCESETTKQYFIQAGKQFDLGGQIGALVAGNPERALTPEQAEALAKFAIQFGLTDLTYNNFYFTKKGQVAIIDTEPVKRAIKKRLSSYRIASFLGNMGVIKAQQAIIGMAKLKLSCSDPLAQKRVAWVETKHALWSLAKEITKLAIACLIIAVVIPNAVTLLPAGMLATALKTALVAVFALKALAFTLGALSIFILWMQSRYAHLHGVPQMSAMELQGQI